MACFAKFMDFTLSYKYVISEKKAVRLECHKL